MATRTPPPPHLVRLDSGDERLQAERINRRHHAELLRYCKTILRDPDDEHAQNPRRCEKHLTARCFSRSEGQWRVR